MKKFREIKNILRKEKKKLRAEFKIKELGIFGSYVRGEKRKKTSDIDILVDFDEVPGLFKFIELEDYLSKVLGVKADLVMKDVLKPDIGKHILAEVIYL